VNYEVGSAVGSKDSEVYDPDTYPVPGASIAAWPVDLVVGYAVGEVGSSAESIQLHEQIHTELEYHI